MHKRPWKPHFSFRMLNVLQCDVPALVVVCLVSAWQSLCTDVDHQGNDMSRLSLLLQSCNDGSDLFVNISLQRDQWAGRPVPSSLIKIRFGPGITPRLRCCQCLQRIKSLSHCLLLWLMFYTKLIFYSFYQLTPQCHNSDNTPAPLTLPGHGYYIPLLSLSLSSVSGLN